MAKRLARLSDEDFYRFMAKADPFEIVIKSAIIIESEIEEIFDIAFEAPKHLLTMGMTYEQKMALVLAIGLDERFKPVLKALATVRNKFAHNLDVVFGSDEAKGFYSNFSKIDRKLIKENYDRLSLNRGLPFDHIPPEDLFILCVITLRAAVLAAKTQTRLLLPPPSLIIAPA